MKPTELRIGNLVMYNGEVVKVEQITKKKIGYHRHKGETRMNYARLCEIEPIPITDELLLNNGFDRWGEIFYKDGFECARDGDKWCMSCNCFEYYLARLNGIHQLQNAYQLITGKELEIKV